VGQLADVGETSHLKAWLWVDDKTRGELQTEGYRKRLAVGTYTFEWAPHICGRYRLKLERERNRLFASQDIQVSIEDEIPEVSEQFDFDIAGVATRTARCGQKVPLDMTVTSKGSRVDLDPKTLKVRIFGNGKQKFAEIVRKSVGQYQFDVESDTPGFYAVTVLYENYKPVKTKVIFHEPTLARNSIVDNMQSGNIAINKPAGFTIQSRDVHGQTVGAGGDIWEVTANGPVNLSNLKIEDHLDGRYTVNYTLPKPGLYTFNVTLNGTHAKKSPFKVTAQ